jgi:hypothetical protein
MTSKELKTYFQTLFFVNTGKTDNKIDNLIDDAIIAGKEDFWAAAPWVFKEKHDTLTTTASSETVNLPEDFDGILSVREKTSTHGLKLVRMTASEYDRAIPYSGSHSEGTPRYYKVYYDDTDRIWKLALFPVSSAAISLYLTYMVLADSGDSSKKYTAGIIAAVGKYLTMPGSPEKDRAILQFKVEIERLEANDNPDKELPQKIMVPTETMPKVPEYWWGEWDV